MCVYKKIAAVAIVAFFPGFLASANELGAANDYKRRKFEKICDKNVADPFEKFNRAVFYFNDTIDGTILVPLTKIYNKAVPSWGRQRVRGFFNNLYSPATFVNNLLQKDVEGAFKTFFRCAINTTFGILGAVDFAKDFGLYDNPQTFSDTMAFYGAGYGAYLVLPLMGPATVLGAATMPVDYKSNILNYHLKNRAKKVINIGNGLTLRAELVEYTESLKASSMDYYSQTKSIYIQYMNGKNPNCKNLQENNYDIYNEEY